MNGPAHRIKAAGGTRSRSSTRRARGSLSEQEILDAARALIEEGGLAQLSMPALAKRLGAGVTSIYWYFRSKDDLLVALAERVTTEVYSGLPPTTSGPWRDEATSYFTALRKRLCENPLYLEVFSWRGRFAFSHLGRELLVRRLEDEVASFVAAGFEPEEAAHIYTACSAYTRGFALLEYGLERERAELGADRALQDTVDRLDRDAFPVLTSLSDFEAGFNLDDDQYDLGLQLLLDGVEQRAAQSRTRPRGGRRAR